MHFHINLKESYLGLKVTAQHQNHPVLIRAEESHDHTILWKFPNNSCATFVPLAQSYTFFDGKKNRRTSSHSSHGSPVAQKEPQMIGLYNSRKWKRVIGHHFQPRLPVWPLLTNAQAIIKVLFLIVFIIVQADKKRGQKWQARSCTAFQHITSWSVSWPVVEHWCLWKDFSFIDETCLWLELSEVRTYTPRDRRKYLCFLSGHHLL